MQAYFSLAFMQHCAFTLNFVPRAALTHLWKDAFRRYRCIFHFSDVARGSKFKVPIFITVNEVSNALSKECSLNGLCLCKPIIWESITWGIPGINLHSLYYIFKQTGTFKTSELNPPLSWPLVLCVHHSHIDQLLVLIYLLCSLQYLPILPNPLV